MGKAAPEVEVGSVWRYELLGSVAVYEVVEERGDVVVVAVREAPGLSAGVQLRMTRAAVADMALVSPAPRPSRRT
jgi:hypothetical protein